MIPCFGIGFEDRIFLHSLPQGNIGKTRSEQCAIKTSPWRHVLLSHQCHCILTPSCPLRELSDRQTESQMFSCYTTLVISHVWTYRLLRSHNAICQYRIFIKIPPIYSLHWLNATTIDIYHKMTQNKSLCHRSYFAFHTFWGHPSPDIVRETVLDTWSDPPLNPTVTGILDNKSVLYYQANSK